MIILICFKTKQSISEDVSTLGNSTSYLNKGKLKEIY